MKRPSQFPATRARAPLTRATRVLVKLGTGVLTAGKGHVNPGRIRALASQARRLRKQGIEIVLVTSGAIGAGMARLGLRERPLNIHDLQACAAIGQNLLMHHYESAFSRVGLVVGQVLLTHGDFYDEKRRDNARQTLHRLLKLGVIPIINENDVVSSAEIKFGDNDQLASLVHKLVGADATILLSTVEGFYIRDRKKDRLLKTIASITASIRRHAGGTASHRSVGGMKSKILAARRVNASGQPLIIAGGHVKDILPRLLAGEEVGTVFLPRKKPLRLRRAR